MYSKKNIIYIILLLGVLVYGIFIGRYQIFPYQQLQYIEDWVTGDDIGPENIEIIETSLQRILINEFPVEKDYSPEVHHQGGALTSIDSLIYVSSNRNDRGKEELVLINTETFQRIDVDGLSVPMNYDELLSSPIMDIEGFPLFKFRVNGLYVEKKSNDEHTLFASHSEYHPESRCITYSLSRVALTFGKSGPKVSRDWETIFRASPCLYPEEDQHGYDGEMSGGPILNYDEDRLLVSVGNFHRDGVNHESLPMDTSSTFGKLVLLDKKSGEHSIFAIGLRNTQGIFRDAGNNIWATDHGPQGGDELNLITEGQNYGWPQVTYGIHYGNRKWPLNEEQGTHDDFVKPIVAWVPSVATSTLIRLDQTTKFPLWRNDLLVGSLGDKSLHRVRLDEDNHVAYIERIEIGYRIRELTMLDNQSLALLTDSGLLLILDDGGPVYEEIGPVVEARRKALERYDQLWEDSQIDELSRDKYLTAEAIFIQKCSSCHNMNKVNGVGPHLVNIFDREIGSIENFNYSTALTSKESVWSPELFKDFLLQRTSLFSNTTMPNIDLSESEVDSIIHYVRR
jgi:cytochrome c2